MKYKYRVLRCNKDNAPGPFLLEYYQKNSWDDIFIRGWPWSGTWIRVKHFDSFKAAKDYADLHMLFVIEESFKTPKIISIFELDDGPKKK